MNRELIKILRFVSGDHISYLAEGRQTDIMIFFVVTKCLKDQYSRFILIQPSIAMFQQAQFSGFSTLFFIRYLSSVTYFNPLTSFPLRGFAFQRAWI